MDCSIPGFPVHHQLLEPTQTHVHWVSDAIQPSHPLSAASPPTFNLFQHRILFQWVSSSHQLAKSIGFSFSISPSNEYSELISFRINWFDLLAIQGTLKSLLQHPSSKASILRRSAFFTVHLSHPRLLSCSKACGIFLDQGSNPCPLHWQEDFECTVTTREVLTILIKPLFPYL